MKLFLDDVREPYNKGWEVVRSYDEFTKFIEKYGVPEAVSFDHDLAQEHYHRWMTDERYNDLYATFKQKTGLDCARWLCQHCGANNTPLPTVYVHSANPQGSKNICDVLMKCSLFVFEEELDYPIIQYERRNDL